MNKELWKELRKVELKDKLVEIVKSTGKLLLRNWSKSAWLKMTARMPHNLTVKADLLAEKHIMHRLERAGIECEVLSEESGNIRLGKPEYKLYVDPLDGTLNYYHGIGHFCVSIAMEEAGTVVAGIVYDPVRDELFVAERGEGSFLNGEEIKVSKTSKVEDALCLWLGLKRLRATMGKVKCLAKFRQLRVLGSAALDLSYVACARADAIIGFTAKPWDVAAAMLIVEEAGGIVTDFEGKVSTPYLKNYIGSNPLLHSQIIDMLR